MSLTQVCDVHFGYRPMTVKSVEVYREKPTATEKCSFFAELKGYFSFCLTRNCASLLTLIRDDQSPRPDYDIRGLKHGIRPDEYIRHMEAQNYRTIIAIDMLSGKSFDDHFPFWRETSFTHPAYFRSIPHIDLPLVTNATPAVIHQGNRHQDAPTFIRGIFRSEPHRGDSAYTPRLVANGPA